MEISYYSVTRNFCHIISRVVFTSFVVFNRAPAPHTTHSIFHEWKKNYPPGDRRAWRMLWVVVWGAVARLKTTNEVNTTLELYYHSKRTRIKWHDNTQQHIIPFFAPLQLKYLIEVLLNSSKWKKVGIEREFKRIHRQTDRQTDRHAHIQKNWKIIN